MTQSPESYEFSKCSWGELNWGLSGEPKEVGGAWASESRRGEATQEGCLRHKRNEGLEGHREGAMPLERPGSGEHTRTAGLLACSLVPPLSGGRLQQSSEMA